MTLPVSKAVFKKAGLTLIRYDAFKDAYLVSNGRATRWIPGDVVEEIRARTV